MAHAVRVVSPRRGEVLVTVTWRDPLTTDVGGLALEPMRMLAATVGRTETGPAWTIDLRRVPHWLVVGATQSGKSNLLAARVARLASMSSVCRSMAVFLLVASFRALRSSLMSCMDRRRYPPGRCGTYVA